MCFLRSSRIQSTISSYHLNYTPCSESVGELFNFFLCVCLLYSFCVCLFIAMFFKVLFTLTIVIVAVLAQVQHIAVVENDAYEQMLSHEFRNPFYKTARVRAALTRSSWLGPGEELVFERQAEKIPRSEIYSVLSHAGLIPRNKPHLRKLA